MIKDQELKPTQYEIDTWEGRKLCDETSLGVGYLGSCTLEVHVNQLRDLNSWVHVAKEGWLVAFKGKEYNMYNNWIDVNDSLPDEELERALIVSDGVATVGFYMKPDWYYITACGMFHSSGIAHKVTHWMPIQLPDTTK